MKEKILGISRLGLIALTYFVVAKIGLAFVTEPYGVASIWPASGIALAVLLLSEWRAWFSILVTICLFNMLANLTSGNPLAVSVGFAFANAAEAALGAWLLNRFFGGRFTFANLAQVLGLLAVATLANAITALFGAAVSTLNTGAPFGEAWLVWWIADGLGILLITPLIVAWANRRVSLRTVPRRRLIEAGALMFLSILVALFFQFGSGTGIRVFLGSIAVFPLLLWAGMRFGMRGVTTAALLPQMITLQNAIKESGVFVLIGESPTAQLEAAQVYVTVVITVAFVVAAVYTERKRTEKDLRVSEQYARSIINSSLDMIVTTDPERKIVEFNRAAQKTFGYTREQVIGKHVNLLYADAIAGQAVHRATFQLGTNSQEVLNKRKNGEVFVSQLSASALRDSSGTLLGIVGVSRDITESKRAEVALLESEKRQRELAASAQRQAQELSLLDQVRTALAAEIELSEMFRIVVESIAKTFGYTQVSLYLLEGDQLVLQRQVGYDRMFESIPLTKGISGRVMQTGKPVLLVDVRTDPAFLGAIDGITSEVCVPLFDQGRTVGILNIESLQSVTLTEADLRLMTALSEQINVAIGRARLYSELQRQAILDDLTSIYNRRHWFELGVQEFNRTRRFSHPLSAIMIDIDHFKDVNDQYGHATGDQVLKTIAERLRMGIREFDVVGRYGGEEFSLLLPETDLKTACQVAERLRACISNVPVQIDQATVSITISLGVSRVTEETLDLAALLDRADAAMYAAKQAGRNRVEVK